MSKVMFAMIATTAINRQFLRISQKNLFKFSIFNLFLILLTGLICSPVIVIASQVILPLISFKGAQMGAYPNSSLIEEKSGYLYGTTAQGGSHNRGTIFKLTPEKKLQTIVNFDGGNGWRPNSLVLGNDDNFYGTTETDGSLSDAQGGTIFRMTPNGKIITLFSFRNRYIIDTQSKSKSPGKHGLAPNNLILGKDGNFYGTTQYGGTLFGCGTIFKLTPNGELTTLVIFTGRRPKPNRESGATNNYASGCSPNTLIWGKDNNLYGASFDIESCPLTKQCGIIFRLHPSGKLTTLVSFDRDFKKIHGFRAYRPNSLVQGRDGNLYGTTMYGGAKQGTKGTFFRLTPDGIYTTLFMFHNGGPIEEKLNTRGQTPTSLMLGKDGDFYGTTLTGQGPSRDRPEDSTGGTIFKINTEGKYTHLGSFRSFSPSTENNPLVQAKNGVFYGVSLEGGEFGKGTIFQFTP